MKLWSVTFRIALFVLYGHPVIGAVTRMQITCQPTVLTREHPNVPCWSCQAPCYSWTPLLLRTIHWTVIQQMQLYLAWCCSSWRNLNLFFCLLSCILQTHKSSVQASKLVAPAPQVILAHKSIVCLTTLSHVFAGGNSLWFHQSPIERSIFLLCSESSWTRTVQRGIKFSCCYHHHPSDFFLLTAARDISPATWLGVRLGVKLHHLKYCGNDLLALPI